MMQPGLNFMDTDFSKINFLQIKPNAFFYGADINNARKFSKMDNLGNITVIEGGGGGGLSFIPITFAALKAAQTGSTLIPGSFYLITDFQTVYDQPDFDNTGAPKLVVVTKTSATNEPLLIQALTINLVSDVAFSQLFPFDTIEYDSNFIVTEYMAASAKGRISLRIDEFKNRTDYDHRTILFLRYETAPGSGIFTVIKDNAGATAETLTFGTAPLGNFIGNFAVYHSLGFPFLLSNNIFGNSASANIFYGSYNNTVGNSFIGNTFNNGCNYINIGDSAADNILNDLCTNFNLGNFTIQNIFGSGCFNMVSASILTGNNLGIGCSIIFGPNCESNNCGIGVSGTVGSNVNQNIFGHSTTLTLGANNQNCTIGNNCTVTMGTGNANFQCGNSCVVILGDTNLRNSALTNNTITLHNGNDDNIIGHGNTIIGNDFNTINTVGNGNAISFTDNASVNKFGAQNILTIPTSSQLNIFGNTNSNATFNAPLQDNNFGDGTVNALNFAASTHVYAAYNTTCFMNAAFANRLSYFSAIDVLTIVNVNA